jgi:hypothetical protein
MLAIGGLGALYLVVKALCGVEPGGGREEVEVQLLPPKIRVRRDYQREQGAHSRQVGVSAAARPQTFRARLAAMDWFAWHRGYKDSNSGLSQRGEMVQDRVRAALDAMPPGPVQVLSICAGQGGDLIGVLAEHRRGCDVRARLVELDERNAAVARRAAVTAGLDGVEVVVDDASLATAYRGAVPAELILACGVFGNISEADIRRTITCLPGLLADNGMVIWTRHRLETDITPAVRGWFKEAGFRELAFAMDRSGRFSVGMHRLVARPSANPRCDRLFTFVNHWQDALDG